MDNKRLLSVISPFLNEADGIEYYFSNIIPILESLENFSYEIICIDDGSTDNTFDMLRKKFVQNKNIKVYKFSRNFGKEVALTCGLDKAKGDIVIPFDADLQDPPELIPQMIQKWEEGHKVVLMQRGTRNEILSKRLMATLFYKIISILSENKIYANVGDFRLMDRQVVNTVTQIREQNRFMRGILSWGGYKTAVLTYDRPNRKKGSTTYGYRHMMKYALDGIFSFSSIPLKIWSYIGMGISVIAFIYALLIITMKIFWA